MTAFLIYLFECALIISILYLFYKYLYYQIAYFNLSRYFMLGSLLTAILIPVFSEILITQHTLSHALRSEFVGILYGNRTTGQNLLIQFDKLHDPLLIFGVVSPVQILFLIWLLGSGIKATLFGKQLSAVNALRKSGEITKDGVYTIVNKTDTEAEAFSFFKTIFLNSNFDKLTVAEKETILSHEKIHADMLHSLDNMFFEIAGVFLWFNPLMPKLKMAVREIHEFVTDNVITGNKNRPDYSRLLVKMALKERVTGIRSPFSDQIKTRVRLISFPESPRFRKRIFYGSIPILMLVLFSLMWTSAVLNSAAGVQLFTNGNMIPPLEENQYQIVNPYFTNKILTSETGERVKVSHYGVTYAVQSKTPILATVSGTVTSIERYSESGLEYTKLQIQTSDSIVLRYDKQKTFFVRAGQVVGVGEAIGETADNRLYPTLELRTEKKGKPFNPIYCY